MTYAVMLNTLTLCQDGDRRCVFIFKRSMAVCNDAPWWGRRAPRDGDAAVAVGYKLEQMTVPKQG